MKLITRLTFKSENIFFSWFLEGKLAREHNSCPLLYSCIDYTFLHFSGVKDKIASKERWAVRNNRKYGTFGLNVNQLL